MTPPEEDYRFFVRIPQRDDISENAYQQNLTAFFLRMNTVRLENEARVGVKGDVAKKEPLNLFPTTGPGTPNASNLSSIGRHVKEWKGGAKYNKVGCIGKGAFAVVYKMTAKFDGVPYAAKELEKRRFMKNGILDQKVDSEMKIMRKIKHPNVVQYIEHIDWEDYLYIIMEFVPGGDLGSLINEHGFLPEANVKTMAAQLLSALKHLHDIGITHRDIKPDNILIYSRDPFHVKLTDFGLSKMIDSEETFLRTFCGTLLYCAPEVYSEYREYDRHGKRSRVVDRRSLPPQRYGNAVDIWSLAGVLFYSLCGKPPYPVKNGTSYQELLNQIMTQALDIRPLQRANISENGIRFVRSMLHVRPEYRASIEELEHSSWLTGGPDSLDMSMEEDEVDMIGDGYIDPELEEGTSQLSINAGCQANESQEENGNQSDLTEMEPLEIPNSFESSNSNLNGTGESYGFLRGNSNPGGRLFGEVNVSAVGSSGAIPLDQLNLPVPAMNHRDMQSDTSYESRYTTQSEPLLEQSRIHGASSPSDTMAGSTMPNHMPPPSAPHLSPITANHPDRGNHAVRSSSLMGAESMVGHLNMHSPSSAASPAASPAADSPGPQPDEVRATRENGVSLRRPREDDTDDDESWQPPDLPPKRQRRSEREIDMIVPPSIFWDPKDKSTHHNNYPRMSSTQFAHYQKWAESKGERFVPGQATFEMTMQSFRSSRSRSSSLEPETTTTRANSEPTKEEGRLMLMKRDERQLADDLKSQVNNGAKPVKTTSKLLQQPAVGNDFQPPKRILAKILATSDSALPAITFNISDSLTSWGRGPLATICYPNVNETRIPKYAFKILFFKPGFYGGSQSGLVRTWDEQHQDMTFFISTKASQGIWINGIHLPSHDHPNPTTKSKFWGQLRHGDVIELTPQAKQTVKFRFECFWGRSTEPRGEGDVFRLVQDVPLLNELDKVDLVLQKEILGEQDRRREEERKILALEKEKEQSARQAPPKRSFSFTQSFMDAPHST
ncbi:kinase-like protein [Hyaloscypha variabilis]